MKNEILLICSLFLCYGSVLVFFALVKKTGLYAWTVIATISANIEVLILITAFGVEQTLGNILFASSFLVTDIMSELYGKKEAQKAVLVGCMTSLAFIMISQLWLQYVPSSNDFAMPAMQAIFSNTPRVMIAGLVAYALSQAFDVWVYHAWWNYTKKKTGTRKRFLWVRNNASTLMSQLINTVLFTWGAFWLVFDTQSLLSIALTTYVMYVFTSIADTPFVYIARKMHNYMPNKSST
ncbi:MAG TPA: queuosine precursor transporter [Treponemataceae bacterium]|nr:queuosine precursor transporter [Treponemataceae bacterium]